MITPTVNNAFIDSRAADRAQEIERLIEQQEVKQVEGKVEPIERVRSMSLSDITDFLDTADLEGRKVTVDGDELKQVGRWSTHGSDHLGITRAVTKAATNEGLNAETVMAFAETLSQRTTKGQKFYSDMTLAARLMYADQRQGAYKPHAVQPTIDSPALSTLEARRMSV